MYKSNRCQPLDPEPNSKAHKLTSNPQTSIWDPNQKPPKIAITNETLKAPNFNFPNSTLLTQEKKTWSKTTTSTFPNPNGASKPRWKKHKFRPLIPTIEINSQMGHPKQNPILNIIPR